MGLEMDKPIGRRIFVFVVRERQRMRSKSGLYVPNSSRGSLTRAEDVWVMNYANSCWMDWRKGQHLLIADGWELDSVDHNQWEECKDDPVFSYLKKFANDVEGKVTTASIHEGSVLAEVEGDLIQDHFMW